MWTAELPGACKKPEAIAAIPGMGLDFGAAGQDRGLSVRSHNLVRLFMMSLTERKLCPVAF